MFFSYNIRNISGKFEENCSKNEGEDKFLVIFKISEKIDHKKFAVHTFVLKTFNKNFNISKVKKDFSIL